MRRREPRRENRSTGTTTRHSPATSSPTFRNLHLPFLPPTLLAGALSTSVPHHPTRSAVSVPTRPSPVADRPSRPPTPLGSPSEAARVGRQNDWNRLWSSAARLRRPSSRPGGSSPLRPTPPRRRPTPLPCPLLPPLLPLSRTAVVPPPGVPTPLLPPL